ncbi:MAG: 50S ribosomal protein L11 [Candidatus Wildermuthbacteria bacterium RIFCSPHIGHO2_01_FULL_49_22b]|uniref:Large ribosomal subunit protein uL11 n=1 Tax=Candidatus Wildermuthbacteria bacterium RIFCSPHIGHO2_01_FULL_49_22b TaxID=1802448 RepID=A0A1G2QXU5_9BACT|nr:MAG: 50S ribosomal protein L11 [Candidatus Wildermuthbacteria bacterium RIFCSPHIGHO2_01_FULL_49_22b]
MAKKVKAVVKLHIKAGEATPAPPVGPALAPHGLNMSEFCSRFNEATKALKGFKIPVDITVYVDRSYEFKLHQPPAAQLIKKALGIEKGSGEPNKIKVARIFRSQLEEIAKQKMSDLNTDNLEAAQKTIEGTAKSLGIEIIS